MHCCLSVSWTGCLPYYLLPILHTPRYPATHSVVGRRGHRYRRARILAPEQQILILNHCIYSLYYLAGTHHPPARCHLTSLHTFTAIHAPKSRRRSVSVSSIKSRLYIPDSPPSFLEYPCTPIPSILTFSPSIRLPPSQESTVHRAQDLPEPQRQIRLGPPDPRVRII